MDVLLSGLHHQELLLLTDLLGQNADLLHLFVLAVIIRVVLPSSLLQLLLFLQIFQFLKRAFLRSGEQEAACHLCFHYGGTSWKAELQKHQLLTPHLHDVGIDVVSDVVALPHLGDLIVLLTLVHQVPVF